MDVASKTMGLDFQIQWSPFFLDPRLPGGEGTDKMQHYKAKFGAERVAQMMPRMVQTFKEEGIDGYNIGGRVGNTMDSHRLMEHAMAIGGPKKQDALCLELFQRYFINGHALSSKSVLLEAAAAANVDGAEAVLEGEGYSDEVWAKVEGAYGSGVSGVPHFRVAGGGPGREVSGGQPPEAFLRIFAALASEAPHGFAIGSEVTVSGLGKKPEHNGKVGTVLGSQGSDRIQVKLSDGTMLALKPDNLEAAPAAMVDDEAMDR